MSITTNITTHFSLHLCISVTDVFTLSSPGKWIWGICLSERATAQRNSPISGTGSSPSVTASALGKYFQHKLWGLSSFPEFQAGVLPHTGERRSLGRYTAPETTHTHRDRRGMSTFPGSDTSTVFHEQHRKHVQGPFGAPVTEHSCHMTDTD